MSDFDPTQKYVWPSSHGRGRTRVRPTRRTLTADTLIDTSTFANSLGTTPGVFTIQYDGVNQAIDLVYTPVPEPGTLILTAGRIGPGVGNAAASDADPPPLAIG